MASQPPPDIDPPAAESQETQANPDDGSAARREKTREFWKTRIRCTLRIAAAAGIEADIANVAASHPHFVRAFELAANDYALVVPEVMGPGMPPNPTDRFFKLWERDQAGVPGDDPQDGFVPIDAKSFCYTVAVLLEEYTYGTRTTKHLRALIHVTPRQVRDCQALIISSLDDGNWVAFVPRYYYQLASQTLPDGSKNVWLGSVPVAMARINPLPPILAPFVMHKKNLAEAFDNMLAHVQDGAVRL